jgi:transposase
VIKRHVYVEGYEISGEGKYNIKYILYFLENHLKRKKYLGTLTKQFILHRKH